MASEVNTVTIYEINGVKTVCEEGYEESLAELSKIQSYNAKPARH
jgi:hypothetical protein